MTHTLGATVTREWYAFLNGVRFFTRLHVPDRTPYTDGLLNASVKYLPAIGLLIGVISALAFVLSMHVFPQSINVLIAMATGLLATGAFHEDGLADTADGLGGGWDKMRILAIMKDSRVGSYGVICLTMALLFKFICLNESNPAFVPVMLIASHAFSRFCAVLVMSGMPYVGSVESSKSRPLTTKPSRNSLLVATAFGLLPLALLPPSGLLTGLAIGLMATVWLGRKFQKWLGGYTGDCLGAVQQVSEVGFYLGLLATLS